MKTTKFINKDHLEDTTMTTTTTCQECKDCIWWIQGNCYGENTPCEYKETYEDWDNINSCITY